MTEKDKMLRQLMYDANYDQELIAERQQAKELCYDYNHLRPSDEASQRALMQRLLGSSKKAFCILAPFWCDYGYNIEIGENFFANHNTVILDAAKVTFGDNVFIAPNCGFYTAGHPIDTERRNHGLEYAYPITVGREEDYVPLASDPDAEYDRIIDIDLSSLKPMIACPHSPDNVVEVASLKGVKVDQVCIGSCTNSLERRPQCAVSHEVRRRGQ